MNRRLKYISIHASEGFTLVEVMVAITILVLVVIPLASFYAASLATIQKSLLYSQAMQLCRERIEQCQSMDYHSLYYWNPALTPSYDMGPAWNTNRDPDPTDNNDVYSYDPTDLNNDNYPIPIYRDYYDNSTGRLIDPNYNGLCDDDLDGDGRYGIIDGDPEDIQLACPPDRDKLLGGQRKWTDYVADVTDLPQYMQDFAKEYGADKLLRVGDGYYDTVVEGIYANSFDPFQYGIRQALRQNGSREEVCPILDFSLQVNPLQDFLRLGQPDYRHREQTFRTFARMTTIIDPTPELKDPNIPDPNIYAIVDNLYMQKRLLDGYTTGEIYKLSLCAQRDLPLSYGIDNRSVGVDSQGFDRPLDDSVKDLILINPFTQNYSQPIYGKKVIVTVFFLSGEGEQEDLNGDGFPDGENFASSNNVRMERMFYNDYLLGGSGEGLSPPVPEFNKTFYDSSGHVRNVIAGDKYETDPCSFLNRGLPYLDSTWPGNL